MDSGGDLDGQSSQTWVDTVEWAYRPGASDGEWLRGTLERLAPRLSRGLGLFGWYYDASKLPELKVFHPTLIDVPEGALEAIVASAAHPETSQEFLARHYASPAGSLSEQLGSAYPYYPPLRDHLYPLGIRDLVTINALDVDGRGCAVNVLLSERAQLSERVLDTLEKISSHLIAAYRLRRNQSVALGDPSHADAVLTPSGAVEHLQGEAALGNHRAALVESVAMIERARGSLRHLNPEEALSLWRALVSGQWSLVDFVDSDGKRFLVARMNAPPAKPSLQLTAREAQIASLVRLGHSNKLIAYDLGLSESTVANHVANTLKKLSLRSRNELARLTLQNQPTTANE